MEEYPQQFENPQVEQEFLEGRMREAHAQFERVPSADDSRGIIRNIVKEHTAQQAQGESDDPADLPDAFTNLHNDEAQVKELVHIAFARGMRDALRVARALDNPHILDDFHDTLTQYFYDRLIAAGVIEK